MFGQMAHETPKGKIEQQIEENLKRVYSDALKEPVPAKFQDLLDQLRQKEMKKDHSNDRR